MGDGADELQHVFTRVDAIIACFQDPMQDAEEAYDLPFELSGKERYRVHSYVSEKGYVSESVSSSGGQKTMRVLQQKKLAPAASDAKAAAKLPPPKPPTEQDVSFFATYARIPFPSHAPQLLEHYMEGFEGWYAAKAQWELFRAEQPRYASFKNQASKVTDAIVARIKADPEYAALMKREVPPAEGINATAVYSRAHVGKAFLSLDLRQGNYAVLRKECPGLFEGGSMPWEAFAAQFTDSTFLAGSKYLREVVFGKAGFTKKAKLLQEAFMDGVHRVVASCEAVPAAALTLRAKVGDEVVYEVADPEAFLAQSSQPLQDALHAAGVGAQLHYQVYRLEAVEKKNYFVKRFLHNSAWFAADGARLADDAVPMRAKMELKCVPKKFMLQVLRWVRGEPIQDLDLHFVDEGMLCRYCTSIFDTAEQKPLLSH